MSNPPQPSIPDPRRILVRGVNWLGDAVMTTPALFRLRERFPDAHIALATPKDLKDLWLRHQAIDEIISFNIEDEIWDVARKIRLHASSLFKPAFDLAIVFPNSPRSALEVWLARIPWRLGYARPWRNWFLTQAIPTRPGAVKMRKRSVAEIKRLANSPADAAQNPSPVNREPALASQNSAAHQVHEYLHLVAALGANRDPLPPYLAVTHEEINGAVQKFNLAAALANNRPLLAVNPGAEYGPAKRWPVERFIAATRDIQKRTNGIWLILGGTGDIEVAGRIEFQLRGQGSELRNLAGQTSLRELCALLKVCRVLLTNDTGPMHVAAALGTPVVVPFGSTSPELTGPGLPGDPRHRLLQSGAPCSPCFLRECPIDFRCMNGIGVERVVEAVVKTLKR